MYRLIMYLIKLKKKFKKKMLKIKNKILKFLNSFHFFRKYKKKWDERNPPVPNSVKIWNEYKKTWDKRSLSIQNFSRKIITPLYWGFCIWITFVLHMKTHWAVTLTIFNIVYLIFLLNLLIIFLIKVIYCKIFYRVTLKEIFFDFYDYIDDLKKHYRKEFISYL